MARTLQSFSSRKYMNIMNNYFKGLAVNRCLLLAVLLLLFFNCKAQDDTGKLTGNSWFVANCEFTKRFDQESNTTYYLTRIKHTDTDGKLIKLHMEISDKKDGETVRNFAIRKKSEVAINASMGLKNLPGNTKQPVGIQIIDGVIKQDLPTRSYTLGIKNNNELVSYGPGTSAEQILKDGSATALTAFVPLILNHEYAPDKIFKVAGNLVVKHPRQVIAQFDNKDILFMSCGGRGFDGDGMTAKDLMRILKDLDVRFAFNLDGGGSTSTIIGDQNINKMIDENGSVERMRPNFLYVVKN